LRRKDKIEREGAEFKSGSEKTMILARFFGNTFEKTGKCAIFYGYIFVREPNPTNGEIHNGKTV
jgi:hypothetical protein